MPIYESETITREQLFEMRRQNRCQVCHGELDVFMDFDKNKAFLACRDWRRTQHQGIERLAEAPFEPNIVTRREEMVEELGKEKADKLIKYQGVVSLTQSQAIVILKTIWPDAPEVDVIKAAMLCAQYSLNPLNHHIFLIPFNKGEPDETWAIVMGIKAKRLLASRRGPFSYVDNTPRIMTEKEQQDTFGTLDKDRIWVVTKLRDPSTNAESVGYGFWLNKDKVKGELKGNTRFNMAAIRSESQALDRLRPGEMPFGIEAVEESAVEGDFTLIAEGGGAKVAAGAEESKERTDAAVSPPTEGKTTKIAGAPPAAPINPKLFKSYGELAQAAASLGVMPGDVFKRAHVKKWEDFKDFLDAWTWVEEIVTERQQRPKML